MQGQNPFPAPAGSDGLQKISGTCSTFDVINLDTGNHAHRVNLVSVPTVGVSLDFFLTYSSLETVFSTVGHKWRHNYQARLDITPTLVTYFAPDGRQTDFTIVDGHWTLHESPFLPATLTNPEGTLWRLTFREGDFMEFEEREEPGYPASAGRLTRMVDKYGNTTTLTYLNGDLIRVTEPTGRFLLLDYYPGNGLLSRVIDPRGNPHYLGYDADLNLTTVTGPEGCVLTFGYDVPANHLITSREDARLSRYAYTFDGEGRLHTVTDPELYVLTYTYSTVAEWTGDAPDSVNLRRTQLLDARGKTWEFRFDVSGNLWREIDPLGHHRRMYWDPQQQLLYNSDGYASQIDNRDGPRDNANNRFRRRVTNTQGALLFEVDAAGLVTAYTRDEAQRITSVTPGHATLAVQGNWFGTFGQEGYVLCSFEDASADVVQLPAYVSSSGILNGGTGGVDPFVRAHGSAQVASLMDPRTPVGRVPGSPDRATFQRGIGFWRATGSAPKFSFRIPLEEDQSFNLTLYTHSADLPLQTLQPLEYYEQFGRDLLFVIDDVDPVTGDPRQQEFHVPNNAAGVWVTFPVVGTTAQPITVTVWAQNNNPLPVLSALAFDPYEPRKSTFEYTPTGDLERATDPQLHSTEMDYLPNGLLTQVTDALNRETHLAYEDPFLNLTKVVDALLGETHLSYDFNGNLLEVVDPEGHAVTMRYDGKNRLIAMVDAMGFVTILVYDLSGNLIEVIDPRGITTQLFYTPANRLFRVVDALGNETLLAYNGAGQVATVTDPRGNFTQVVYDDAGRVTRVIQPDSHEIHYALDAIDRLVALTTPNGNLANLAAINLAGAKNRLKNPGAEELDPYQTAQTHPRYWNPPEATRSTTVHRTGSASFETTLQNGNPGFWSQPNLNLHPGGRYLTRQWVSKVADGQSATTWISAVIRDFNAALSEIAGSTTNLDGSSTAWSQTPLARLDLPGDAQFTLLNAPVAELRLNAESPAQVTPTTVYSDDVELLGLSVAYGYDGEHLREVATPDGARMRLERDRFGWVQSWVDPQGRRTTVRYDNLDRVVSVVDPLGNAVHYLYDAVGNLVSFVDARGHETTYVYDELNRLLRIVYPDLTFEDFTYTPAGNLASYTNVRGQQRLFNYDAGNRLILVTYQIDASTVALTYDSAGNVLTLTERNGDVQAFSYDDLYRLTAASRIPAVGSENPAWSLASAYDANGNRTELQSGGPSWGEAIYGTDRWGLELAPTSAIFGQAIFGTAVFGEAAPVSPATLWTVPPPGFDAMDRMPGFLDASGQAIGFEYDPEGRRTRIQYPNGTLTEATYDLVGRLLRLRTTKGETELLDLVYGYSQASDRIAMQAGDDTWEYGLDRAGRLIRESLNRLVEREVESFQQGELNATEIDFELARIKLMRFSDSFAGSELNTDRWRLAVGSTTVYGAEVRQSDGLHFVSPRGFTNRIWFQNVLGDPYGLTSTPRATYAEHRLPVNGDFDVQVDFSDWQCESGAFDWHFDLQLTGEPVERVRNHASVGRVVTGDLPRYEAVVGVNGVTVLNVQSTPLSESQGKLRVKRAGSVVTMAYWDEGTSDWIWPAAFTYPNFTANPLFVSLAHGGNGTSIATVRVTDLQYADPEQGDYVGQGTYTSAIYDAGRDDVEWGNISWDETLPAGCDVRLQVAVASSPEGPYDFVGPDGTDSTFFTTHAGEALDSGTVGRYCRYRAYLSGDTFATPAVYDVHISHDGLNASRVTFWEYDPAGNRTRQTRVTDGGTEIEITDDAGWPAEDRINELNQIRRRDVITGAGTVTWRYGYDADGNQTSKTDGTDTWTRVWDEDNRLLSESKNDVLQVSFTYDNAGRMLTRTKFIDGVPGVPSRFLWQGWNLVGETSSDGVETSYYCPQSRLHRFQIGDDFYTVHTDALGSVRAICDAAGLTVSQFQYDAWGRVLHSSSDNIPGGFPYKFVGGWGCRADGDLQLVYMRKRWYDPSLGRFVSRDLLLEGNLYSYVRNQPHMLTDVLGLTPTKFFKEAEANDPKTNGLIELLGNADTKLQVDVVTRMRQAMGIGEDGLPITGPDGLPVQAEVAVEYGLPLEKGLKGYTHIVKTQNGPTKFILQLDRRLSKGVAALVLFHEFYHYLAETNQCPGELRTNSFLTPGGRVELEYQRHAWVYSSEAKAYLAGQKKWKDLLEVGDTPAKRAAGAKAWKDMQAEGQRLIDTLKDADYYFKIKDWTGVVTVFQQAGYSINE